MIDIVTGAPAFVIDHAALLAAIVFLLAGLACLGLAAFLAVRRQQGGERFVTAAIEEHAVWSGYDGEGVYGWSCTCGDGGSDFTGLDDATLAGTDHLLDEGAVPA